MNSIKKTVLGMLIGLLAFGISAYTTKKNRAAVRYYKTDPENYPNAGDPRGYKYYSDDRCELIGEVCSAVWNLGTNPAPTSEGALLPLTGVSLQSTAPGHFE